MLGVINKESDESNAPEGAVNRPLSSGVFHSTAKDTRFPEETRTFVILLVALFVGILTLSTANLVVFLSERGEEENTTGTYPQAIHEEDFEELNEQASELTLEEAKALYEEKIENAGSELEKSQIRVEYGRYLLEENLSEESLLQFDLVDETILGANYKMLLYAALREYSPLSRWFILLCSAGFLSRDV